MDFSTVELDAPHRQLQEEVSEFVREQFTEDAYAHEYATGDGFNESIHLAMGQRGWIMPAWPTDKGGAGLDRLGERILELELEKARVPWVTLGTTRLIVSAVERYASDAIRDTVLTDVASGHARLCLGYTEPDGGSDIAGAKTKATRDGDEWIISGSKMFTTGAHNSQYVFLITRTDPDLPKHKGLTMFLVPLDTPGIEIQGIHAFSGERTNIVFYDEVRISDDYRLGEVNGGWTVLRGPLDEEHNMGSGEPDGLDDPSAFGMSFLRELHYALDDVSRWATTERVDGTRPVDDPAVVQAIGELTVQFEAAIVTPGPAGRVAGSDTLVAGAAALLDLVGPEALIPRGQPGAIGDGQLDFAHRFAQGTATYGGTVEVFRTIIAQHQLGLPRPNYPGAKVFRTTKS
ncbi:acyl-CoA dehydrogenase family protein [Mycetocola zhadangensis]|uniref:acyl-CoA dehydrogenase family protein n=1 Tax=Mycetocola zhadangensis TaxID=1164595 RepID=UPI003A4E6186